MIPTASFTCFIVGEMDLEPEDILKIPLTYRPAEEIEVRNFFVQNTTKILFKKCYK